jgi:Caspase domain
MPGWIVFKLSGLLEGPMTIPMKISMLLGRWLGLLLLCALPGMSLEKITLIIGNNYGMAEDAPLRYASEDAKSLHAALTELGGIEKGRGYLLIHPTKAKVLSAFQEILGRTKEIKLKGMRAMVLMYYSGHGSPTAFHLGGQYLKLDEVRTFFSQLDADIKVLVADACHSGALISAKGVKLGNPLPIDFTQEMDARGTVILTSSSASELSRESNELQGSVFTHHFVSGLRGGADRDRDNRVSLQEAYDYARLQVASSSRTTLGSASSQVSQTPQYELDLRGSAPLILTEMNRGMTQLKLAGLIPGEYAFFRERQSTMATLRITSGDTVSLALPKGAYRVRRAAVDKVYLAQVDLNWSDKVTLNPSHFHAYPIDILRNKGNLHITHRPWQVFLDQEMARSFPENLAWTHWTSLGLRYQWENWSLGWAVGMVYPHTLRNESVQVSRTGFNFSTEARYSLFERSRYLLFTGFSISHWNLDQAPTRADEEAIRNAGYPALEAERGNAWSAAASLGGELRLPMRLAVSLRVLPGFVFWKSSQQAWETAWNIPTGLSLGYRF